MASSKEMTKLRRELQRDGWRIEYAGKHYKAYHPLGGYVAMSVTPSDANAHHQARREIRKLDKQHSKR